MMPIIDTAIRLPAPHGEELDSLAALERSCPHMAPKLIACPACNCHAKPSDVDCPQCGAHLRRPDGTVPRAAAAILLGLSALASCGPQPVPAYGLPPTADPRSPVDAEGAGGADPASAIPDNADPDRAAPDGGVN